VGERLQKKKRTSPARLVRRQAFTLLVQAYERVRSAVRFWREGEGERDWEKVAPSIYLGRARARKEKRRLLMGKGVDGVKGGEAAEVRKAGAEGGGGVGTG
jgi:hypothetical protein